MTALRDTDGHWVGKAVGTSNDSRSWKYSSTRAHPLPLGADGSHPSTNGALICRGGSSTRLIESGGGTGPQAVRAEPESESSQSIVMIMAHAVGRDLAWTQ